MDMSYEYGQASVIEVSNAHATVREPKDQYLKKFTRASTDNLSGGTRTNCLTFPRVAIDNKSEDRRMIRTWPLPS